MIVAHVSMTPVAGACWAAAESFREAGYDSFCVAPDNYGDGRLMPTDYKWLPNTAAKKRINAADVIFCYQGYPFTYPFYPQDKPTIGVYVSQPKGHIRRVLEDHGWPWCVLAQYQTRLYQGCTPVPELIPMKHEWYQPAPKAEKIRIVYSPSNNNMDGWDDKGYEQTIVALKQVESDDVEVEIITHKPLWECLRLKANAHIVIDECITGSYHGNSLQGLAQGCVVINNADELCAENIRLITGGYEHPFVTTDCDNLLDTLQGLIMLGRKELVKWGRQGRRWFEIHYQPATLIKRHYLPLIEKAIAHA